MAESWRKKKYYKPRVMISTERVLDPQYDDALLCITGAQLEMLRNLTQYLHRRSTFSQDETSAGYLAPTSEDWDSIQAIVSDLEEKLMGCEELTQLFTDMLAQLQCVCSGIQNVMRTNPSLAPVVGGYLEDGTLIPGDVYGEDTLINTKSCAVAQLTYARAYDWLTVYIEPFQETSADVMLGLILTAVVVTVGIGAVAIPAATIIAVLLGLADMTVEGSIMAVRNAIVAAKDDLICAVYGGLQTDYAEAHSRALTVLDGIGTLTYLDKVVLGQLFAPWTIWLAATAYDNATDWAIANVDEDACDDCGFTVVWEWTFPPCPGELVGNMPCSSADRPSFNAVPVAVVEGLTLPNITSTYDIHIEVEWKSSRGAAQTVGFVGLQYEDGGSVWQGLKQLSCTTSEPAGTENAQDEWGYDYAIPRNVLRLEIHGMGGQGEEDPWPMMLRWIRITVIPHV